MCAQRAINIGSKTVKPVLSVNATEARRRMLNLYRAWYRQIPYIVKDFDVPITEVQCREKLREYYYMHKDVTDIRVIDMLVVKGQMELKEVVNNWKQGCHIMSFFKRTVEVKPKDFLSKFFNGSD